MLLPNRLAEKPIQNTCGNPFDTRRPTEKKPDLCLTEYSCIDSPIEARPF